jgi:photosystem II P680 reaction center D1 protein
MHGSLVTSSLIRETTENESANEGYKFGQEEETYNIVAAHGYFGRSNLLHSTTLVHYTSS